MSNRRFGGPCGLGALCATLASIASLSLGAAPADKTTRTRGQGHTFGIQVPPKDVRLSPAGGVAGGGVGGCDGTALTQNTNPGAITPQNTPMCLLDPTLITLGTGYARSYVAPFTARVDCVTFATEFNMGPEWAVQARIYIGDINGPFSDLTLVSQRGWIECAPFSGPSFHTVALGEQGPTIEGGTAFVVEVFTPSRDPALPDGDGGSLFFASNNEGQSAPSYIRADECDLPNFTDVATIGFPQTHIIINPILIPVDPPPFCGSSTAGSCFVPHATPNCNDANCCELLCSMIDPLCCQIAWDLLCVQEAMLFPECTLQPPPCQGLRAYECQSGCVDNFAAPVDPASVGADLGALAASVGAVLGDFDETSSDRWIAHTFEHCWPSCGPTCPSPGCGTIVGATLAVRVRSLGGLASNDSIGLYDGQTVLWASNIGTLAGMPGWPLNSDATLVLNLGPTPIPNTIQVPGVLASLCDGDLGMLVQDDTRVDYAKLTVFVCPCDLGIRIPFARDEGDNFTTPTPTTPSAALLATVNCGSGSLQQYDVQALDQCFVETITGLPPCIMGANLTMGVLPDSLWWTDGIALEVVNRCGKTFKWSKSLTALDALGAFSPPLASGQPSTLTLDLGNLPPSADGTRSVLSEMLDGSLDIYLQDDTGVDFIFLEVLSCECGSDDPVGACCLPPEVPGGDYHCADLTEAQCEFNGGTWYGANSDCTEIPCEQPCAIPPWGMVAWYPLEEPSTPGNSTANDITIEQNHGTSSPFAISIPGVVNNGHQFDGNQITVPYDPSMDFGCKPFSIDLWVRRANPGPNSGFVNLVGNYGSSGGWVFGIDETNGTLELLTESNCLRCIAFSGPFIPPNVWTHVAVTVSGCDCSLPCIGAPNRTVTFYINGIVAGTGTACCDLTSLSGPNPTIIGGPVWVATNYVGGMDEIEIFCRELFAYEVFDIWNADSSGKCKDQCHASWDRQVCMNFTPVAPADITICNDANVAQSYTWFVTPSGACSVTGVTYSPSSGVTIVPPGDCVTISVTANVSGASGLGDACFDVTFINDGTGQACTSMGMLFIDICGIYVDPTDPVIFVPDDNPTTVNFTVINTGGAPLDVPFFVKIFPSDMESANQAVKLNGLPPGTRYIGNLVANPGPNPFSVEVEYIVPDSFRWYDVVFSADLDGDDLFEPLSSVGFKQVPAPTPVPCPADLNGDGKVDAQDLAILLGAWSNGGGPADINGDGVVNAQDLAILLGAWGDC